MFCPKCGKSNADEDLYCLYCGADLVDNQNFGEDEEGLGNSINLEDVGNKAKTAFIRLCSFIKEHKKASSLLGGVAIVIIFLLIISATVFTPKRAAERYFKACINADASLAYSCVDVPDSPFTTRKLFTDFWERKYKEKEIYNYDIVDLDAEYYERHGSRRDLIEHSFEIDYYLRGDNDDHSMKVTVVKDSKKELLLFPSYKVMPSFLVSNYQIVVPPGTTVTLGDTELKNPMSEDGLDVYTVETAFDQEYELTLERELCATQTKYVEPESDWHYYIESLPYSQETADAVYQLAREQMQAIISAAIARTGFPQTIAYDENGAVLEVFQAITENMTNLQTGTGYYEYTITNTCDESYEQSTSVGESYYSCSLSYDYSYGEVRLRYDEPYAKEGTSSSSASMNYHYIDGTWFLYDFDM